MSRRALTDDEFRRFVELAKILRQEIQSYASDDEYEEHGMRLQGLVVASPLAMRTNATGNGRSEAFAKLSPEVAGAMDALVGNILKGTLGNRIEREILLTRFLDAVGGKPDDRTPPKRYGPDDDREGYIYWDSKPIKLTITTWRFLRAVWGEYDVAFGDIGEVVWGEDTTNASTIRSRAVRASEELHKHGIDLPFSCEKESVSPLVDWPE